MNTVGKNMSKVAKVYYYCYEFECTVRSSFVIVLRILKN